MATRLQLRRDTAANWTTTNPTLAQGEVGVETDTRRAKIGDGLTPWATLPYWPVTDGDITSVTAGTGLTGGGSSGDVTVSIDSSVVTLTGSQTLTNKTIALGSNSVSGTISAFNSALTDADFATTAGIETLSNKTLSSPALTGTMTGGTISGTTITSGTLGNDLSAGDHKITTLATPTNDKDAATKQYADARETAAKSYADSTFIPLAQRGAANGVATLGSDGKIPSSELPATAIAETFVVNSQSAMLGLTAQVGDIAVRTDVSKSFILQATPATTLGNWVELLSPTDAVQSVDGRTGTVSLSDLYDAAGSAATRVLKSGDTMTGDLNMNSNKVTNLGTPTVDSDAATKLYVDNVAGSATAAAASASAAAASYDAFDDRYLGAKSADPTLDNDGDALLTGALYWNTVVGEMRVYDGAAWQQLAPQATFFRWTFTAAGGETSLSGLDDYNVSLSYNPGATYLYLNGVMLVKGVDYTATNGTSITGLTALVASDVVEIISLPALVIADVIPDTIWQAKGDLLVGSASVTTGRLPVGTNGHALIADSAEALGVKWSAVGDVTLTGSQTLTNKTLTTPTINSGTISTPVLIAPEERCNVVAAAATGTINFDVLTSGVWFYTSNASANFTLNFRGNSGTTLNAALATGDAITVVFINTNGATPFRPTVFQIDGSAVTPLWQGGTAPTAGNASSRDAYTFTIIKTAATPTYVVLAAQTRFA